MATANNTLATMSLSCKTLPFSSPGTSGIASSIVVTSKVDAKPEFELSSDDEDFNYSVASAIGIKPKVDAKPEFVLSSDDEDFNYSVASAIGIRPSTSLPEATQVNPVKGKPRRGRPPKKAATSTPKMAAKKEEVPGAKPEIEIKPKIDAKRVIDETPPENNKKQKIEEIVISDTSDVDDEDNGRVMDRNGEDRTFAGYNGPWTTRRVIRDIYRSSELLQETKDAEAAEHERRDRLRKKKQFFNEEIAQSISDLSSRCILDYDRETKEILVEVDKEFVPHLKKHQLSGIKFMFDSTIESIQRLEEQDQVETRGASNGGILAHCMGLGKTFQVVVFVNTILTNPRTLGKIKKILIIVPLNVIKNFETEFDMWFEKCNLRRTFHLFELYSSKNVKKRVDLLEKWQQKGGVCLITGGLLTELMTKVPPLRQTYERCLLDPGADMVIIDEGHLLKNDNTRLNQVASRMKTLRRLILTGTPMQNNLMEYYVMVSFVKPSLLGSREEFSNRFANPITNGQYIDSEPIDVFLMKKRYFVLHNFLDAMIHRRDYSILVPYLPPKCEYVISIKLSKAQEDLYQYYLDNFVFGRSLGRNSARRQLFLHFRLLGLIWNHPALLVDYFQDCERRIEKQRHLGENFDDDVADDNDDDDEDDNGLDDETKEKKKKRKRTLVMVRRIMGDWPRQFLPPNEAEMYNPDLGPKFKLLLSILSQCEIQNDKLLVFSQSLDVLDLIERLLKEKTKRVGGKQVKGWVKNEDYFRIDGSVNCSKRTQIVEQLNDNYNKQAKLLLISTLAGGVGINLVGANRAIIFDSSWNPASDVQAIYRIFRYGQTKRVYVYRFAAAGTMENQIYKRQITKQSISLRVVDEFQIDRYYTRNDLYELYNLVIEDAGSELPTPHKDPLLASLWRTHRNFIVNYHEHDSLLEHRPEESLNVEQRSQAWEEYTTEKERDQSEFLKAQAKRETNTIAQQEQQSNHN